MDWRCIHPPGLFVTGGDDQKLIFSFLGVDFDPLLLEHLDPFTRISKQDIQNISTRISSLGVLTLVEASIITFSLTKKKISNPKKEKIQLREAAEDFNLLYSLFGYLPPVFQYFWAATW